MNRDLAVRQTMLAYANEPFKYGTLDCCLFAAKVADLVEGVDYSKLFKHSDEAGAMEYIDEAGGLKGLISKTLNRQPCDVAELQTGDPVLLSLPILGELLGVYVKGNVIVKTPKGALKINAEKIKCGWRLNG